MSAFYKKFSLRKDCIKVNVKCKQTELYFFILVMATVLYFCQCSEQVGSVLFMQVLSEIMMDDMNFIISIIKMCKLKAD